MSSTQFKEVKIHMNASRYYSLLRYMGRVYRFFYVYKLIVHRETADNLKAMTSKVAVF